MLARRNGMRPLLVVIAPVRPGLDKADFAGGAAAVIHCVSPGAGHSQGLEMLCELHGLTRVETRLMAHLHAGLTVSEAATEMRIKLGTARTYLKQIFAKTDAHRQTDLIALMSGYMRAIRGEFDFSRA